MPIQVHERIHAIKGNLLVVKSKKAKLGEIAKVFKSDGTFILASVIRFEGDEITLQSFSDTRGISTGDQVVFQSSFLKATISEDILGRSFTATGDPRDGGSTIRQGTKREINQPSFNPVKRIVPKEMVRTNIPLIDVFNCLVKSQKIPIFSIAGQPYNELLMRIGNQTDADIVIVAGMGLTFDRYQAFLKNARERGTLEKTVFYTHLSTDPAVECLLVPDMALAAAEEFAINGKNVLVLLTDMTAFADSIKEIMISMDQVPSNRGYPGSLYSDLASRYEKAVDIEGSGSITLVAVTTMPGGDVTHPVPDNTGYITEGQFYLHDGIIDPFGSLSRLKQNVIGKTTREDHGDLANALIRLYADSKKASERQSMGFKVSSWDEKLLKFAEMFDEKLMSLEVNIPLEDALDLGWNILSMCFKSYEVGMKQKLLDIYWPSQGS